MQRSFKWCLQLTALSIIVFAAGLVVRVYFQQNGQCPAGLPTDNQSKWNKESGGSRESPFRRKISRQFSISPEPCPVGEKYLLVLICFSRPNGQSQRQVIRDTWGQLCNPICGVRLLFIIGRVLDQLIQQSVILEAQQYGDIIQSTEFDDIYRSASHKALRLLQWGSMFCPYATYIAKIDDDNWLNVPMYVQFLRDHQKEDYVYGFIASKAKTGTFVRRTLDALGETDRYYVPREEYPPDQYPEYLAGILYAFPTRFIPLILAASKRVQMTFNDDVYVCGLLVDEANLTRSNVPFVAYDQMEAHRMSNCPKCGSMSIHYSEVSDMQRLWSDRCCTYYPIC